MNNYQHELLVILAEESGELVQEICKIFRFGLNEMSHHIKDKTHLQCLESEIGDLFAMVQLLEQSGLGITSKGIEAAKQAKLLKVVKWMQHENPSHKPITTQQNVDTIEKDQLVRQLYDDLSDGYDYGSEYGKWRFL